MKTLTAKRIRVIAEYYVNAPHEPFHPSYSAFVASTKQQWYELVNGHWAFQFLPAMTPNPDTYGSSIEMFQDIACKRLKIDTQGQSFAPDHPMAEYLLVPYRGIEVKVNEAFRAVHDVLGHGLTQCPFETLEGELEALENHMAKYPREAHSALMGETLGQLCHYFSGRGFVETQHAVILPEEFWK